MKKLLLALLSIILVSNLIICSSDSSGESITELRPPANEDSDTPVEPVASPNLQIEIGEGSRFPISGSKVACECSDNGRFLLDCEKACSGLLRGGWKKKNGKGLIQLTHRGFKCVCNGANKEINCFSAVPKRCGGLKKTWARHVSFKAPNGQQAVYDSLSNKVVLASQLKCPTARPIPD